MNVKQIPHSNTQSSIFPVFTQAYLHRPCNKNSNTIILPQQNILPQHQQRLSTFFTSQFLAPGTHWCPQNAHERQNPNIENISTSIQPQVVTEICLYSEKEQFSEHNLSIMRYYCLFLICNSTNELPLNKKKRIKATSKTHEKELISRVSPAISLQFNRNELSHSHCGIHVQVMLKFCFWNLYLHQT